MRPESELLDEIEQVCARDRRFQILLFSQFIGVEGRIYTRGFWERILDLCEERDLDLVIDEGMWFDPVDYPTRMNNDRTIRLVSPSKKYGNPGMKMGYLLAPEPFLRGYYDRVSTFLGGPPSLLFLLAEFLYLFETVQRTGAVASLAALAGRYRIDEAEVLQLFDDARATTAANRQTYATNRRVLERWVVENADLVHHAHIHDGINVLIEPKTPLAAYDLFTALIQEKRVSIFPGRCLGDPSDRLCRVTILESTADLQDGLQHLADFLRSQ
ncbi:MAG: aminotransferase class I/II-fold pyridoxal phosphate-dependent enzyme [Gemmataceae bacterium]